MIYGKRGGFAAESIYFGLEEGRRQYRFMRHTVFNRQERTEANELGWIKQQSL